MAIRAIDYCPPVDLRFSDYLSALLTVDREVTPDDDKYGYRDVLLRWFEAFHIRPAGNTDKDGTWRRCGKQLVYSRTHFESLSSKEQLLEAMASAPDFEQQPQLASIHAERTTNAALAMQKK